MRFGRAFPIPRLALWLLASAPVVVTASASPTLPLTLSAAGSVQVTGTAATSLPLTLSAAASIDVNGAFSQSLPLALNAVATVDVIAAFATPLPLTISAEGSVAVTASVSKDLPLTLTAAGVIDVAAAVTVDLPLTLTAEGSVASAAAAALELPLSLSATGTVGAGAAAILELPLSLDATGSVAVTVSVGPDLPLTLTAAGSVTVAGSLDQFLPFTLAATAVVGDAVTGAFNQALPLALTATGVVAVAAESISVLPLTLAATGSVGVTAALPQLLPLTLNAAGSVQVTGAFSQVLPLALTASGTVDGLPTIQVAYRVIDYSTPRYLTVDYSCSGFVPAGGAITANGDAVLPLTLAATSVVGGAVTGDFSQVLPLTLAATGVIGDAVTGAFSQQLPLALAAAGTVALSAAAATPLPLSLSATGSVDGGASGETEIDAFAVTDNTTGNSLVQIVLPLQPGPITDQMIADRKIYVEVNGVEQAVFIKAARGRHQAGFRGAVGGETVSMAQGHFTYNLPDTTPIPAKFILNRVRTTTDLSETDITDTHLSARRAMMPSSAAYLCSTELTFQPLIPVADMNAQNLAYFSTLLADRFQAMKNDEIDAGNYISSYESSVALFAAWCQRGSATADDREYFWQAWRRSRGFMNYSLPNNGIGDYSPELNPHSIVTGVTGPGLPNEQNSQRLRTFGVAYKVTGQISFWNLVCLAHGWTNTLNTSESVAAQLGKVISDVYYGRFNLRGQWGIPLSILIDATKGIASSGGWTGREDHVNQVNWALNAWAVHAFDSGGHRDGMRGSWDGANEGGGIQDGAVPHFQWALLTDWMLSIQLNVIASADLAGAIQANVDAMLNDLVLSTDRPVGTIATGCSAGGTSVVMNNDVTGRPFRVGDVVSLGWGIGVAENRTLTSVAGLTLGFDASTNAHGAGETVYGGPTGSYTQGHPTPGYGQGAVWGYEYWMTATQGGLANDPWTLPMWAASVKFREKYFGNDTVNGATISTWYTRLIAPGQVDPAHLTWGSWKIFGESFGNNMLAPYLDQVGIPDCPSSIRTPTQY